MAVEPKFRRSGIARKLVEEVEKRFHRLGINIIACLVENWNTEGMTVFEKLGYIEFKGMKYYTKRKFIDV